MAEPFFLAPLGAGPIRNAVEFVFPPRSQRIAINDSNALMPWIPFLILWFMASLARRPGTYGLRIALVPFAMVYTFRIGYLYWIPDLNENGMNHLMSTFAFTAFMILCDYGFQPKGMLKLSEVEPGVSLEKSTSESKSKSSDRPLLSSVMSLLRRMPLFSFFADGWELMFNIRGIGWQYGTGGGLHIPKDWRNTENTTVWLLQSLPYFFIGYLIEDMFDETMKCFPVFWAPHMSIWSYGSNAFERFAFGLFLHCIYGLFVTIHLESLNCIIGFCAVLFFGSKPTSWPPLFDRPWASTSLHHFWSQGWHQFWRRGFIASGGLPLQSLFGGSRTAFVFGTFLSSALFHDLAFFSYYPDAKQPGWPCYAFFLVQPFGLMMERWYKKMTGKNVGGWGGWVWTMFWILILGQPFVDSFYRGGFHNGTIIPPEKSLMRQVVFPRLRQFIDFPGPPPV